MSVITQKVSGRGELLCGGFLEPKALLGEKGEGGRLLLDRIFTTGLPKEEAGRYYSKIFLKSPGAKIS